MSPALPELFGLKVSRRYAGVRVSLHVRLGLRAEPTCRRSRQVTIKARERTREWAYRAERCEATHAVEVLTDEA